MREGLELRLSDGVKGDEEVVLPGGVWRGTRLNVSQTKEARKREERKGRERRKETKEKEKRRGERKERRRKRRRRETEGKLKKR